MNLPPILALPLVFLAVFAGACSACCGFGA